MVWRKERVRSKFNFLLFFEMRGAVWRKLLNAEDLARRCRRSNFPTAVTLVSESKYCEFEGEEILKGAHCSRGT